MSDEVQFDTDVQNSSMYRPSPTAGFGQVAVGEASGMAGWLIRHGFAKTPAAAQGIMAAIVVVNIVAIFIIIKYFL